MPVLSSRKIASLKKKLDYHYSRYDKTKLSPDPLEIPHKFHSSKDIELAAFLSAVFAYGNVKMILKILYELIEILGENPARKIADEKEIVGKIRGSEIKYRFYSNEDIVNLFRLLNFVYARFGSLENLFLQGYDSRAQNVFGAIENFSRAFLKQCEEMNCLTRGTKFMFPLPSKGSSAKRMNLFLRWMARKDELDFGLWEGVEKSKLVIPLDTHIAKISRDLGLTSRKTDDRKTAEEITETLKLFDSDDPVKYDFALCHIGMRKEKF